MGLNYVPYERTYRGLPVVGGDFVVSTDDEGKILATSVAQTRQVRLRSVKPTRLQGRGPRHQRAPAPNRPRSASPASSCCRPSTPGSPGRPG